MDESFRSVLPYLRLQDQTPPWLGEFFAFLGLVVLPALILFYWIRKHRLQRHAWEAFLEHAAERGLNPEQGRLLAQIARQHQMKHPLLLLSSIKSFDHHLGRYAHGLGPGFSRKAAAELGALRRSLGFDQPTPRQALYSTRQVSPGQTLMVWPAPGRSEGFCPCVVVKRDEASITLAPLLRKDEECFAGLEAGAQLKVRLWGPDHLEYRFRTHLLPGNPESLLFSIRHGDRLERIQQRDFFRMKVRFEVVLYPAGRAEPLPATVLDLSGGGMAVLTDTPLPLDQVVVIDPHFAGDFPLAGLHCQAVKQADQGRGYRLSLEFLDLSPHQEAEIIQSINTYQLHRAS
ncbi:MAG: PilZ domain-containing protein [Candidatus Latescibacteria bacterium]|nr:PilZ domain-containing protein [Candidatus Latescibacterota bacterium]